jgi:hypothetical protein
VVDKAEGSDHPPSEFFNGLAAAGTASPFSSPHHLNHFNHSSPYHLTGF